MHKIKGKMKRYKVLQTRSELRSHLPKTYWLTAKRARKLLKTHSSIFIKPDNGSMGVGIIKIRRSSNGYYIRTSSTRRHVHSSSLHKKLRIYQKSSKNYIVQRGLHLARYNGKVFDIRMYLQKPATQWLISGMAARVASGNKFVTNYSAGGHPQPLQTVLLSLFNNDRRKVYRYIHELKKIALLVARTLEDTREFGIDLAIDTDGYIWIIEANSKPQHQLFTQLPDKTMLYRIRRNKQIIERLTS